MIVCHLPRLAIGFPVQFLRLILAICLVAPAARASLDDYDSVITADAGGGLKPVARLPAAVTLTGTNKIPFDFGPTSGDVTFEFILEGDTSDTVSAYLAVGANANSNLRYELWQNTGQLGFTELGVADYAFEPGVPSPAQASHVAYVWNADARTMELYLNGALTGSRSDVSSAFAMPAGPGWLGANPQSTESMVGTIYRLNVYAGRVSAEVILAHANAFRSIVPPPSILSFTATPPVLFTPASTTLRWDVREALAVFIAGVNVTGKSELTVSPVATQTYTLTASNSSTGVTATVTVRVNPEPVIHRFAADQLYIPAGDAVRLEWETQYAQHLSISPGVGELTVQDANSVLVHPVASATFLLTAWNEFGTNTASTTVKIVHPARDLVISEFMADDQSTLQDEDGDYSGWIEIYNPTASIINLSGYFLTDAEADPQKWAFPSTNLAAGSYLLVFASGHNRTQPGSTLHTNFLLANEGEYLALTGPGNAVVHAFAPVFPPQRTDISYGILGGDLSLVQSFGVPTPGAANQETPPPPAPVQFSRSSGVFTNPFTVELTTLDPDAEIRYSLDGSTPGLTEGSLYSAPIPITGTTRVRAIALRAGQASKLSGGSFIKLAPNLAGYTSSLPIMVIENFGAGTIPRKGWNSTGAGIKQVPRQTAAWLTFERNGTQSGFTDAPQMTSLIGIRGRGAYSTEWRQKPYSVEGIDEEGNEAAIAPLGMPRHADWVLYFPDPEQSRDPTLLFNTFAYELSKNMGDYAVRFRWVEAFINEHGGDLQLSDRRGVYAIMEKVARGKDRLDFQPLAADGATGGWLLNINRMDPQPETGWPAPNGATQPWFFHTAGPNRILETKANTAYGGVPGDDLPQQSNGYLNFDNPNGYHINLGQRAAIEGWFKRFEDVLYNDAVWRNPTNGYRRYLDTRDFADYFLINVLTRNGDGLLISMFPWKGDDDKLRMGPAWDYNWASYYISGGPTGSLMHRAEQLWYPRLFADPDFNQLYIDRWWELRRGPLSNAALHAIIDGQAAEISPAKALLNGVPTSGEWTSRLTQMKNWLAQRANWIDSRYLPPPSFNQDGGEVPDGFTVTLSGAAGTIYLTTDGTDPRAPGGGLASSARAYASPLSLHTQTVIHARLRNGSNWSGLSTAVFATPQDLTQLAVTEIMYEPLAAGPWAGEELEFLELKNTGTNTLQLGGFRFTSGIEFTFTNQTQLPPGTFFLLARNPVAIAATYPGVVVNGVYTGKLNNSGELLRLETATAGVAFEMTFSNALPWPIEAAGSGYSAVPRDSVLVHNSPSGADWRASAAPGGSPGADDPVVLDPDCLGAEAPAIVEPPLSQTVLAGAYVSLSVAVTNTAALPIGYRWQRNGEDIDGGKFLLNDHICFLTLTSASPSGGTYTVQTTNAVCAAGFTSAAATVSIATDADADGQADPWESTHGLSSSDPTDGLLDSDGDGLLNWQEYVAGTDPTQAASCLKIDSVASPEGAGAVLSFQALPGRTYAIQFTDGLQAGIWIKLGETVAKPSDRVETLTDSGFRATRFYRLVTPRTP